MKVETLFESIWDKNLFPDLFDFCIILFYLIIILLLAKKYENKRKNSNPEYKYFTIGIFIKIFMSICICLVYTVFYKGGDTTAYYLTSEKVGSFLLDNPNQFFTLMNSGMNSEDFQKVGLFTNYTWPFMYNDESVWAVIKLTCILTLFGFKNYFTTSILLAVLSYIGIWKLFRLLNKIIPGNTFPFAISFLFIPSVAFWGSGILKDTYTFSALCWFVFCYYNMVMRKRKILLNLIGICLSLYIIIIIKIYIFFALVPSIMLWSILVYIRKVKSRILKFLYAVTMVIISIIIFLQLFSAIKSESNTFSSIDKVLEKAVVIQQDLKSDYYGGESFDIGEFDPTVTGVLSKFPQALTAGLFRPFIWEARNPMMLISAIENSIILLMVIWVIIGIRSRKIFDFISKNPYLIFALSFSVFFSFAVGLTTSNFGSLVRYKIPGIPFFISILLIVYRYNKNCKAKEKDTNAYIAEQRNKLL